MKKLLMFIIIFSVIFIIGCTAIVSALAGLAITIGGELICNEIAADDQMLYDLCTGITGIFVNIAAGTIEVHNVNGQWVTLTSEPMQFNLMENQGEQRIMTFKENIPPGKYDKIRIDLNSIQIQTKEGIKTTVLPNKELIFDTNIEVINNQKSIVELKLDIAKSLHRTEENKLVFAPVMDVKSRKNANIQILDETKKLINVYDGIILDNKKVGMNLLGEIKKDFILDRKNKLSLINNKISIIGENLPKVENPITPSKESLPKQNKIIIKVPQKIQPPNHTNKKFNINLKKFVFTPAELAVSKGDLVRLSVTNTAGTKLGYEMLAFNIGKDVETSQTTELIFTADKTGTYDITCSAVCGSKKGALLGVITVK